MNVQVCFEQPLKEEVVWCQVLSIEESHSIVGLNDYLLKNAQEKGVFFVVWKLVISEDSMAPLVENLRHFPLTSNLFGHQCEEPIEDKVV